MNDALAVLEDLALEVGVTKDLVTREALAGLRSPELRVDPPLPLALAEEIGRMRPERAEVALLLAAECGEPYRREQAMRLAYHYHRTVARVFSSSYAGILWGALRRIEEPLLEGVAPVAWSSDLLVGRDRAGQRLPDHPHGARQDSPAVDARVAQPQRSGGTPMSDRKIDLSLTRWQAAHVAMGLYATIKRKKAALARLRAKVAEGKEPRPGAVACDAMALGELAELDQINRALAVEEPAPKV